MLYNASESTSVQILHHHPQLILNKIGVVELNNVVMTMVFHYHYLYEYVRVGVCGGGWG